MDYLIYFYLTTAVVSHIAAFTGCLTYNAFYAWRVRRRHQKSARENFRTTSARVRPASAASTGSSRLSRARFTQIPQRPSKNGEKFELSPKKVAETTRRKGRVGA